MSENKQEEPGSENESIVDTKTREKRIHLCLPAQKAH